MKKIEAKIIADSINQQGDRITTYLLTFPRFILAELNTHRVFSRNSASSRAIPFEKMVKMVQEDSFIPIAWQKDHKGMQGSEYITDKEMVQCRIDSWLVARDKAVESAKELYNPINKSNSVFRIDELQRTGVTKQLCNRLLEPFMWHTVLVTATEFENFFKLRCPQYELKSFHNGEYKDSSFYRSKKDWVKDNGERSVPTTDLDWLLHNRSQAEIHMQALAEAMWDAYNESIPKELKAGEWHIPFGDKMNDNILFNYADEELNFSGGSNEKYYKKIMEVKCRIATARCARLSYMTFDGEIDYEKDIKLHDRLLADGHASPFEHVSRCLTEEEYNTLGKMILDPVKGYIFEKGWVDNFKGFVSYRRILNF